MKNTYRILIKHDSGNSGPGEIVSAGFTEFVDPTLGLLYDPDTHSVVEESLESHKIKVTKWNYKDSLDRWDGAKFVKETPSSINIVGENEGVTEKTLLQLGNVLQFNVVEINGKLFHVPMYGVLE